MGLAFFIENTGAGKDWSGGIKPRGVEEVNESLKKTAFFAFSTATIAVLRLFLYSPN
jgi:hypothetical protein